MGRLPQAKLARRIEGIEGSVRLGIELRVGHRASSANPYLSRIGRHDVFHVGQLSGLFRHSNNVRVERMDDLATIAAVTVAAGERATVAIVAGENEPLVVPPLADIDARIDLSDAEWRQWSSQLHHDGPHRDLLIRSALALKLLLYSPTGAIAAAAITSVP